MKILFLILAVSLGAFAQEHKVGVNRYVVPTYPPIARQARITSDVVLDLKLNADGDVVAVDYVDAHPMLKQVVLDAIKQWRFVCLDCKPGEGFRHRFTFSWKIINFPKPCEMPGFRRTVLEFPNRLTVEEPEPCIESDPDGPPPSRLRRWLRSKF